MGYWLVVPAEQDGVAFAQAFERFGEVHVAVSSQDFRQLIEQYGTPSAIVVHSSMHQLAQNVKGFRDKFPEAKVYVVGVVTPSQLAMLHADDVVPLPLPESFMRRIQAEQQIEEEMGYALPRTDVSETSFIPPKKTEIQGEAIDAPEGRERILVVTSGKGGDGKTTITAQLAVLLAKKGSVLVIDADPRGNEAEWFRENEQPPLHTVFDFQTEKKRDRAELESYLLEKGNLKLLAAPTTGTGPLTSKALSAAIQAYKPFYPTILIDMHQGVSPELVTAANYASHLILVTTPSLKREYLFVAMIKQLVEHRIPKQRLHIVMNRTHQKGDVPRIRTAIEDIVGTRFDQYYHLPFHEELEIDDDSEYVAVIEGKGTEPYSAAFYKFAQGVTGVEFKKAKSGATTRKKASSTSKKSFFSALFGAGKKKTPTKKGGTKR